MSDQENQTPDPNPAALPNEPARPQPEAPAEPAAGKTVETMPGPEELLRAAELKAAEHYDAWLRARAEMENVRRRAQDDIAKAGKFAAEKFAQAMVPVKDSLEAALGTENGTLETLRSGVELTLRQLEQAFQGAGMSEVSPLGQRFDPNIHQAISVVEADGEPNTVVTVLQKGYLLHDRVIRPALVVVSKARAAGEGDAPRG